LSWRPARGSPRAPDDQQDERQRDRNRGGQLVDEQEQQVEAEREQRGEKCGAPLERACGGCREQRSEGPGYEQIPVAHHRRAEHGALQPRQAGCRVGGVERVVRSLQQIGYDERRVRHCHRHDPRRQPSRRRHRGEECSERRAAERGQNERRPLARQPTAIDPCERKQRQHEQGPSRACPRRQPAERQRGEHGHGAQREIGKALRARSFGGAGDDHEDDHRRRWDRRPAATAQPREPWQRERARERHHGALGEGEQCYRNPERRHGSST